MKIIIDLPEELIKWINEYPEVYNNKYEKAIRGGRVIPTDICSCWEEYPNKNHKFKNGKWKCVDCYKNIDNAEGYKRKTHCRRIKTNEQNNLPGNDTSKPANKKE